MRKHYNPTPSEIVQLYQFYTHCRQLMETIATFIAELRTLAEQCDFGMSLNWMLRDPLVYGVNNDVIQQKLLAESKQMFTTALEIAQSMELGNNKPEGNATANHEW